MPEIEELKLIVSLTDNASPQLQRIRTDLQATQSQAVQNHERFRRQSAETERALKETIGAFQGVGRAVDFFTGRFGAAGAGVAAFGYLIQNQLRGINQYAETLTKLGNAAMTVGTSGASLKSFERAFERVGYSAGQAQQALQGLQRLHADLLRPGSDIANRLLAHAHTPEAVRNMQAYIAAQRQATTVEQQAAIAQRAAQQLYQDNLKYGEQFAIDQARAFLEAQNLSTELLNKHLKINELSQEQIRLQERAIENARVYNEKLADSKEHVDGIVGAFRNEALQPGSPLNQMLDAANAKLKTLAEQLQKASQVDQEIPAPAGFFPKLDPFNPINIERAKRARELAGLDAPGGGTFAPFHQPTRERFGQDYEPPQLQHGGIVTKATLATIGEGGPEAVIPLDSLKGSQGDAQRRDRLQEDTNKELKELNEQLFAMLHPAEGGAGLPGIGRGGGAAPGGGTSPGGGTGTGTGTGSGTGTGTGQGTGTGTGGDGASKQSLDSSGHPLTPKYGEAPTELSQVASGGGGKFGDPGSLKGTGAHGQLNDDALYKTLYNNVPDSLIGTVPKDGAKFGITTGSRAEWAKLQFKLAKQESSGQTNPAAEKGHTGTAGLFQFEGKDLAAWGQAGKSVTDPMAQIGAMNKVFAERIKRDGMIGSAKGVGAASYFGPLTDLGVNRGVIAKHEREGAAVAARNPAPTGGAPGKAPAFTTDQIGQAIRGSTGADASTPTVEGDDPGSGRGSGGRFNVPRGSGMSGTHETVTLANGQRVTVNARAAGQFKGFFDDLIKSGAPVKSLGGYGLRGGNPSQHPPGLAVDWAQSARNVVSPDVQRWISQNPETLNRLERKWGMSGGEHWSNPDTGHFSIDTLFGRKHLEQIRQDHEQAKTSRRDMDEAHSHRMAMDSRRDRAVKVEGTGKLTADIRAPHGTHVAVDGGGVFRNVEVNRQVQMAHARSGPADGTRAPLA